MGKDPVMASDPLGANPQSPLRALQPWAATGPLNFDSLVKRWGNAACRGSPCSRDVSLLCPDPDAASVGPRHWAAALGQVLQGPSRWRQVTEVQGWSPPGTAEGPLEILGWDLLQGGAGLWGAGAAKVDEVVTSTT